MSLPLRHKDPRRETESELKLDVPIKVHHPTPTKRMISSVEIFGGESIGSHTCDYEVLAHGTGVSESILQLRNPGLLAVRNRNEKRSSTTNSPSIVKSKSSQSKKLKKSKTDGLSLLTRRPLAGLKKPLEIPVIAASKNVIEHERATLSFSEDPVAYFQKRKDIGGGHRFIYMIHSRDRKDINFSPYDLKKVPSSDVDGEHFTISATGVTCVRESGETEHMSLDLWTKDVGLFGSVSRLRFFKEYRMWGPLRVWKRFVNEQRFESVKDSMEMRPFFQNSSFFRQVFTVCKMQETPDEIVRKYLLSYWSGKKYNMGLFKAVNKRNIDLLQTEFSEFIDGVETIVLNIYKQISDPNLVQVHDLDVPTAHRRNPDPTHLMQLEMGKAAFRAEKTEAVNRDIAAIGSFIRMADYIILESLNDSCERCWMEADENVSQDSSAVFKVEVSFGEDGLVVLTPDLETLTGMIRKNLNTSLRVLDDLPRVLLMKRMGPLLRDNGVCLRTMVDECPRFIDVISRSKDLESIRNHILDVVSTSYTTGLQQAQQFKEYYDIYVLGQTWDPWKYINTRGGDPYGLSLGDRPKDGEEDAFLLKPKEEPIVDVDRVRADLKVFQRYQADVSVLRAGLGCGAVFIDSRDLRSILVPIPTKAIEELRAIVVDLVKRKVEMVSAAMKYYSRQLKVEPKVLDQFVKHCDIFQRTRDVTPQIEEEMSLVEKIYELFDEFGVTHEANTLPTIFVQFANDQKLAVHIRETVQETFVRAMTDVVRKAERKIDEISAKAVKFPACMKDVNLEERMASAKELVEQVEKMKPKVQRIVKYQELMEVDINNFSAFSEVEAATEFCVRIYTAIGKCQSVHNEMINRVFEFMPIDDFNTSMADLEERVKELQSSSRGNYLVLNELVSTVNAVLPYRTEIDMLSRGKMQTRHWNMLLQECEQDSPYNTGMTLADMLESGILEASNAIKRITDMSLAELELDSELQHISSYWNKVELPMIPSIVGGDEALQLGPTDGLMSEIMGAINALRRIMMRPFCQAVRDSVGKLQKKLSNAMLIVDAWKTFQRNWIVLSEMFGHEEARSALPQHANRFLAVQRKWVLIARYAVKEPKLFSVCAYQSLLEIMTENKDVLETIFVSVGKFLDTKRAAVPRLFFLSNNDVLGLYATHNPAVLAVHVAKMFMHVQSVDCCVGNARGEDEHKIRGIHDPRIYGLTGDDGSVIEFNSGVVCTGGVEVWIPALFEQVRTCVRNGIFAGSGLIEAHGVGDYVIATPSYIAFTSINMLFTSEVDRAFVEYETDSEAFATCDRVFKNRIGDCTRLLSNSSGSKDRDRLSSVIVQLIEMRDKLNVVGTKIEHRSQRSDWLNMMRTKLSDFGEIVVEFGDCSIEHGCEFWGRTPAMVYTDEIGMRHDAVASAFSQHETAMIVGSPGSGRLMMATNLACRCGAFLFIARAFPDLNKISISRFLSAAVSTGSWLVFENVDKLSRQNLSYLSDNLRLISNAQILGNQRFIMATKIVDVNKNYRVMLTATDLGKNSEDFPSQLRAFVRPIAVRPPRLVIMAKVKLVSCGFSEAKNLSGKLVDLVSAAVCVYEDAVARRSKVSQLLEICDIASEIRCSNRRTSEDIVMASAVTMYFRFLLGDWQRATLTELIRGYLPVQETLSKLESIWQSQAEDEIRALARNECEKLECAAVADYLVDNIVVFYRLLLSNNCVIVCGPPNSGKSSVIALLETLLSVENRGAMSPMRRIRVFHGSESQASCFGSVVNDGMVDQTIQYGLCHAVLSKLTESDDIDTGIMHIDGPLTPVFVEYMSGFLNQTTGRMNSLDSFKFRHLKVVIETDSVANVNPTLLGKSGMLVMRNLHMSASKTGLVPSFALVHTDMLLSRARSVLTRTVKDAEMAIVRALFSPIAPAIVRRVYDMKSCICLPNGQHKDDRIMITETLPMYAALLTFHVIDKAMVDYTKEECVRRVMICAFFRIFAPVLNPADTTAFELWLRRVYSIDVPESWEEHPVSTHFTRVFHSPSLYSVKVFKGIMVPIDFHKVDGKPIFHLPKNVEVPITCNDFAIMHAEMLPPLEVGTTALRNMNHFIIYGPPDSGKSSFIRALLREDDRITPLIIPSSKFQTAESIRTEIFMHSNMLEKAPPPLWETKRYALIFDNVDETHVHVLEFIRMLVTTRHIQTFSPGDVGVYHSYSLDDFVVIVTTRKYSALPVRFLGHFIPISLPSLSVKTAAFIVERVMIHYDYSESRAVDLVKIVSRTFEQYAPVSRACDLVKLGFMFCLLNDKDDYVEQMRFMVYLLNQHVLHRYSIRVFKGIMEKISSGKQRTDEEKAAITNIVATSELCYPVFQVGKGAQTLKLEISTTNEKELYKSFSSSLAVLNANGAERLSLKLSGDIIRQIVLVRAAVGTPGRGLLLFGSRGCGRCTLTRFAAHLLEYEFVNIASLVHHDETLLREVEGALRDAVVGAVTHNKKTVLFVRLYGKRSCQQDILNNFVSQKEFTTCFSKDGLESLYCKFAGTQKMSIEQKISVKDQVENIVCAHIKVVIAIGKPEDGVDLVSHRYDRIHLESDTAEVMESAAQNALDTLTGIEIRKTLPESLPSMFVKLTEIARSRMLFFCPSSYYEFIDSFLRHVVLDQKNSIAGDEKIRNALTFLDQLSNESRELAAKLETLTPTLKLLQKETETLQASYATRKDAIEARKADLLAVQREKVKEAADLDMLVTELISLEKHQRPKKAAKLKAVHGITDIDMATARITAGKPAPSLRVLVELCCLILDKPATYESSGRALFMDPMFLGMLKGRMKAGVKQPVLSQALPYMDMPEMNVEAVEAIAPALKVIFEWIDEELKLAAITARLDVANSQLEEKQRVLNDFIEEMNLEMESIDQVRLSMEAEGKAIEVSRCTREEMEKEYVAVDGRKTKMDETFKGVDIFVDQWRGTANNFENAQEQLVGDAIVFAFYLTFCGSIGVEARGEVLKEAIDTIHAAKLKTSTDNGMQLVMDRFLSSHNGTGTSPDPAFSLNASIDSYHVRATLRTPLVIDATGLMLNSLVSSMGSKLVVTTQNASSLSSTLTDAASDGKTLVIQDVDYLLPLLLPFMHLHAPSHVEGNCCEVRVGSKIVPCNTEFKLILMSSTVCPANLPKDLLVEVTLIDMGVSSLETTKMMIEDVFIEYFEPSLMPRVVAMKEIAISRKIKLVGYERMIMCSLAGIVGKQADVEYDFLGDQDVAVHLTENREAYFAELETNDDFSDLKDEIATTLKPFNTHIHLCQVLWEVSRMVLTITPEIRIWFPNYKKLITSVFANESLLAGSLTSEQSSTLYNALITAAFQLVFQAVPLQYGIFYAFMVGCTLKIHEGKMKQEDMMTIFAHMQSEASGKCEVQWGSTRFVNAIEQLKLVNIGSMFGVVNGVNVERFGMDYLNASQPFQVESILSPAATIPTIIISPPEMNPMMLIIQFVYARSRQDNFDVISLCSDVDLIKNIRKSVIVSLNRGNWVVLHYSKPSRVDAEFITDIFTQMTSMGINTNFRLFIVCSSLKYLAPSVICRSKRITIEKMPSVKRTMAELFYHQSAAIRSATDGRLMKKIAYGTALLISLMGTRHIIEPIGNIASINHNDSGFRFFLETLRLAIDSGSADVPFRNVRDYVERVVFGHVADKYDRRVIQSYLDMLIIPTITDDTFHFVKGARVSDLWDIPGDVPISNFVQTANQLPVFPTVASLGMHRDLAGPLCQWILSRWVVSPFVEYCPANKDSSMNREIAMSHLDGFAMTAPEQIFNPQWEAITPMSQSLAKEISKFNNVCRTVRHDLTCAFAEIGGDVWSSSTSYLVENEVPLSWKRCSGYFGANDVNRFMSHLVQQRSLLMGWLTGGVPQSIDVRLLDDLRGFLMCRLANAAVERGVLESELTYDISIIDPTDSPGIFEFMLTKVNLMGCSLCDGTLSHVEMSMQISTEVSLSLVIIEKTEDLENQVVCPLYKTVRVDNLVDDDCAYVDGESTNLVWECSVASSMSPEATAICGAAFFCVIPECII